MDELVLTDDLAFRLERAANRWGRAWMAGVAGIELAPAPDHVLAPCHPERPDLDFQNRVNGLTPADAGLVPDLVAWYAERGVRPWFELVPSAGAGDLLAALAGAGAVPIGFHGVVYGPLERSLRSSRPDPADNSEVDVRVDVQVVRDDEAFATFCRVRTEAHELPAEVVDQAAADLGGWRHAAGVTLYVATVDGAPAATAALTVTDGVGYLADAATLPAFRGHGLQRRLIRRRLDDAAAAGARVACSQAAVAGTSHRNLQREGLTGGFTKLVVRVAGP